MKRFLSLLLIPLSILLVMAAMELCAGFIPLPKKEAGLENPMDPWGISLFSCVPDDKLGYRLKPYAAFGNVSINSLGYAGKEFSKAKEANVFRIVCVGGSTTFSTGVLFADNTWPALLQYLFSSGKCPSGKRVEVINAGVPGYHSWHSRLRLDELDELDPDMYILMDGFNDINASVAFNDSAFEKVEEKKKLEALVAKRNTLAEAVEAVCSKSKAFQVANWYARKWREADHSLGLDEKIKAFNTENNLRDVLEHIRRSGRLAVIVNHPWSVHGSDPSKVESEETRLVPGFYIPSRGTVKAYMWGRNYVSHLNERLRSQFNVPVIDPQPAIDSVTTKKSDVYHIFSKDIVHLSDYGNYVLAGIVFKGVMSWQAFRDAVAIDGGCMASELDTLPNSLPPEEVDWGSGMLQPVCGDVKVSPPITQDIADSQNEHDGWGAFRPASPDKPGVVSLGVAAPPGGERLLFFMPRIARNQGVVDVFLHASGQRTRIFHLEDFKDDASWTPIAKRYMINLSNVADGTYILEFVLTGKHAQLWHDGSGNTLFFR